MAIGKSLLDLVLTPGAKEVQNLLSRGIPVHARKQDKYGLKTMLEALNNPQKLESNKAINPLGKTMGRHSTIFALENGLIKGALQNKSFTDAMKDTFYTDPSKGFGFTNLNYDKIAATGLTHAAIGSASIGALRGAFTDQNGNFDAPGIPYI